MILEFGDCLIDTARRELRRAGEPVHLEPRVYQLLLYLIERRDRVVPRYELVGNIWAGRVVGDAAVNSQVKAARAAVGDDGRSQQWIRTLHRAGYRFVGEVRQQAMVPAAPDSAASADVQRILASAETLDAPSLALPTQASVAILPLRCADRDAATQLLADGLVQDITSQLARAGWLFIVSSGSTFRFRSGPYDPREIGRVLGVRYIVQGTIQARDGQLRVQVTLADAGNGAEIWGESLKRRIGGLFDMQQEITETIAGNLESRIEHREQRHALLRPPASLDAWQAYHRGCWHMYRFTLEDHQLAERFLLRAIELDPLSPRAHAALAFVHWQRAFLEIVPDRAAEAQRSMELARRSLALDPMDPAGHWAVGRAHLLYGQVDDAVDGLQACVRLNPSSSAAQYSLAYALMHEGSSSLSSEAINKARRLSPFDPMTFAMFAVRGQNLAFQHRFDESAVFAERAATQLAAHHYHVHLIAIGAYCNALAGRMDVAAGLYRGVKDARPDYSFEDFHRAFRLCREEHREIVARGFRELEALPAVQA